MRKSGKVSARMRLVALALYSCAAMSLNGAFEGARAGSGAGRRRTVRRREGELRPAYFRALRSGRF